MANAFQPNAFQNDAFQIEGGHSFSADAFVQPYFRLDAFIQPAFTVAAVIRKTFTPWQLATGGTASASTTWTGGSADYSASKAIDQLSNTYWAALNEPTGEWLRIDYGTARSVIGYRVVQATGGPDGFSSNNHASAWVIEWSDDGSSWTTHYTQSTYIVDSGFQALTQSSHRYWRIRATADTITGGWALTSLDFYTGITVDAVTAALTGGSGSFALNAILKRTQSGSLVGDAVLRRESSSSFPGDAVLLRTQTGSFTADASIVGGGVGTLTANAVLRRTQAGSFALDAVIARGDFQLDAVLKRNQTASFAVNAILKLTRIAGSFTAVIFDTAGYSNAMLSNSNYAQLLLGNYVGFGNNQTTAYAGQDLVTGNYRCYQSFHRFEHYPLGPGESVLSARLAIGGGTDSSTTDFDIEAYHTEFDRDDMFTSFRDQAWLQSATLLGKLNTSSYVTTDNVYMTLSDEGTLAAAVNSDADGATSIVFASSRYRAGTAPSGPELSSIDNTAFASMEEPRLTLTIGGPLAPMTVDAMITKGKFRIDALLKRTAVAAFTADAWVYSPFGYGTFTAAAWLQRPVTSSFGVSAIIGKVILDDQFDRIVSPGWGWPYLNNSYYLQHQNQYPYATDMSYVDGDVAWGGPGGTPAYNAGADVIGYPVAPVSDVRFDFYVGPDVDVDYYYGVEGYLCGVDLWSDSPAWAIEVYPSNMYYEFVPEPETWYSVRAILDSTPGNAVRLKLWRRQDPEPEAWTAEDIQATPSAFWAQSYIYLYEGPIDNLRITALASPIRFRGGFYAAADIFGTVVRTGAPTPPTVVGSQQATGTGTSATINKPAGVQSGDLLVAFLNINGYTTQQVPLGWTFLTYAYSSTSPTVSIFEILYKTAGGSEPSSYSWTGLGAVVTGWSGGIIAFRGHDPTAGTAGIEFSPLFSADNTASHDMTAPSMSPAHPAGLVVPFYLSTAANNSGWSTPSGLTERIDAARANSNVAAYTGLITTGPTPPYTSTVTSTDTGVVRKLANTLFIRSPGRGIALDAHYNRRITGSFGVDYNWLIPMPRLDAVIKRTQRGLFQLEAYVSRRIFSIDAVIGAGGLVRLDAVLRRNQTGSLTLNAVIFNGTTRVRSFTADAIRRKPTTGTLAANAVINNRFERVSSATLDALLRGSVSATLAADAVIDDLHRTFTLDADLAKQGERRGVLTLSAVLARQPKAVFLLEALLFPRTAFRVDAYIRPAATFTVAASIVRSVNGSKTLDARLSGAIRVNAVLKKTQSFPPTYVTGPTIDAVIASSSGAFPDHQASFLASALIVGAAGGTPIWLDAVIVQGTPQQAFVVDAFVVPPAVYTPLTVDAYILGNTAIVWPDEQSGDDGSTSPTNIFTSPTAVFTPGMVGSTIIINGVPYTIVSVIDPNTIVVSPALPSGQSGLPWVLQPDATDPQGNPLPDWFKAYRKYRIAVFIDGVEVTGDIIWRLAGFTQNAKTNPGTFELAMEGSQSYDGGEEVIVTIDDFRVFGGYILSVERSYLFPADAEQPITILRGADFNVLFDKLIIYNKGSVPDASGVYRNWKSFARGTSDVTIINKVFSSYVDLPPGFDYRTYVEAVDTPAPEKPWTMPEAGSPLRQVLQSISQVTEAVWWIDPYLNLHYGSRTTVTAPHPITDGLGGISSQQIAMSEDISQLVTETLVWGTLAYTVEGDIRVAHRTSSEYGRLGPWQSAEFRSDLHHTAYINRRADSIIDRYGEPIRRAKMVIFEPGYQAGQVADIRLTNHGIDAVLVIRQMTLTMAVVKEPDGDIYYGVPRYELQVGLDPEDPWDIYDYLPWPDWRFVWHPPWIRRGRRSDKWPEPFDLSVYPFGTDTWDRQYDSWAQYQIHNNYGFDGQVTIDDLSVITGRVSNAGPAPGWAAAYPNGVYQSPYEGRSYSGPTNQGTTGARFKTRRHDGAMTGTGYPPVTAPGWSEYIGNTELWPGHEHSGVHPVGNPINIPAGDLEIRSIYIMRRAYYIPIRLTKARLFNRKFLGGTTYQRIYDIGANVDSPTYYDAQGAVYAGPRVTYDFGILSGGLDTGVVPNINNLSNVIARGSGMTNMPALPEFDYAGTWGVNIGHVEWTPDGAPDLSFWIGEPGCDVDATMSQIWCNLERGQWGPYPESAPDRRWPFDPVPDNHYRLCAYHLPPTVFLDSQIYHYAPSEALVNFQFYGVEVTFHTAAGWGWTPDNRFRWAAGSESTYQEDASWDYTTQSFVNTEGGVLELIPSPQEPYVYDWSMASVFWDWAVGQKAGTARSAFEFIGVMNFAQGIGDADYGPGFFFQYGGARFEIIPGAEQIYRWGQGEDYEAAAFDPYQPFHVLVVQSDLGWATKVWQDGDPMPDEWTDWLYWGGSFPDSSEDSYPYFYIWSDDSVGYSSHPRVRFRFTCTDWEFVQNVDPLVFGQGYNGPPTGGNVGPLIVSESDDLEGEVYGAVREGWGCETLPVENGQFQTTGLVTTGTLSVHDADSGEFLYRDTDWSDLDSDGKDFTVYNAAVKNVLVCYRNYAQNIGTRPQTPRRVDPSASPLDERDIPI